LGKVEHAGHQLVAAWLATFPDIVESPRLMEAVDALNRRFGKGAVTVASAQHQRRLDQHAGR